MSGRDISSNEWERKSKAYYLNPCEAHSLETNCWSWSWSWSKAPAFLFYFLFQFSSLHCGMEKLFVSIFVFQLCYLDTIRKKNIHIFCAKLENAIRKLVSSCRNVEAL